MKQQRSRWPWFFGGVFLFFLGALGSAIVAAGRNGSPVTDRDYYAQGLREGRGVGTPSWRVVPEMREGTLRCTVRDADGLPISGGEFRLETLPATGDGAGILLVEVSPGIYETPLPPEGRVKRRWRFSHGGTAAAGTIGVIR